MRELFEDLLARPQHYLPAALGRDFEEQFRLGLDDLGYNRLRKQNIDRSVRADLKRTLQEPLAVEDPQNPLQYRRHYIFQPYGSQQYPDVVIFDEDRVISTELKFSRGEEGKPMWNGGLPRPNGVYVFGSYGRMDITYFRGGDILTADEVATLHGFFDGPLRRQQGLFNRDRMAGQAYGFAAYVRKAFDQNQQHNPDAVTNFFDNPQREALQQAVLAYLP